jgi:hypothetical protein
LLQELRQRGATIDVRDAMQAGICLEVDGWSAATGAQSYTRFSSAVQMEVAFVDLRFGPHEAIWQDEGRGIRGLLLTSAGPGMDRA